MPVNKLFSKIKNMSVSVITVSNDEWNEVKTAALQTREMISTLIDKQGECWECEIAV